MLGHQSRRIGPHPEKGGMAERDNAAIAEDQIERQSEQAHNRNLAEQQGFGGKHKQHGEARQPEQAFAPAPARLIKHHLMGGRGHAHFPLLRLNRPCGRMISTTTIKA